MAAPPRQPDAAHAARSIVVLERMVANTIGGIASLLSQLLAVRDHPAGQQCS